MEINKYKETYLIKLIYPNKRSTTHIYPNTLACNDYHYINIKKRENYAMVYQSDSILKKSL